MYLRRHRKVLDKVSYDYWTLCESVRTANGPRQRVVASLGKLGEEEDRSAGWDELEALLEGRPRVRQMSLERMLARGEELGDSEQRWELANVNALRVERVRDFGEGWLALSLWYRLGLHKVLGELIEADCCGAHHRAFLRPAIRAWNRRALVRAQSAPRYPGSGCAQDQR